MKTTASHGGHREFRIMSSPPLLRIPPKPVREDSRDASLRPVAQIL